MTANRHQERADRARRVMRSAIQRQARAQTQQQWDAVQRAISAAASIASAAQWRAHSA